MARTPRLAYSLSEFSRLSGLAPSTVQARMDEGSIPELERIGHRRFIPATWVDAWSTHVINQPGQPAAAS